MVAVVSGSGLGLFGSSASALGGAGSSGNPILGRGQDRISVNTATGNLIVQSQDEVLSALGLDLGLVRTYNSQGLMTDDNGDNWRLGVAQKVYNLQGTLNAASSKITKVFGDGREVVYTYDTTLAKYLSTEGGGAHDTLTNVSGTWTWQDGSGRNTETYNSSGQLTASKDADGNTISYTYNATSGLLTTITDASGQVTTLTYTGNNLTSISVSSNSVTQTLVRYTYDDTTNNRLKTVTVDLTPADNSVADNVTYTTTYTYDGTSKRVASITQKDGSTVGFTYQLIDGTYRVKTFTDGMSRLTTLNYSSYSSGGAVYLQTDVVDALTRTTTYTQDSSGRLTSVLSPTMGGARLETRYGYDADGNVTTITEDPTGLNRITNLGYDTRGNLLSRRDSLGNTVTRTYDNFNQVLTEVSYVVPDPDGAGTGQPATPLTTRYVYDGNTTTSESHLRFVISADGRVTEHRYNAAGQRTATLNYVSALYTATAFAESDLVTWIGVAANKALLERVDYAYDFRGSVSTLTAYVSNDATTGNGTGTPSITKFVYDQRGQLLQTIEARGSANTPNPLTPNLSYATTYTYDGLGRVLSSTKWNSATSLVTTLNAYDDANRKTATTLANGLVTTSTYDKAGEPINVTNGTASALTSLGLTTYAYDAGGRLRIVTDPTGVKQFFFYDEADRKVGQVDGNGTLTEFIYDKASEPIKTIRYSVLLGSTRLASLVDGTGNPTAVTLATCRTEAGTSPTLDQVTRAVYDAAGRLAYSIDAVGAVTQINYDGANRVTDTIEYATTISVPRATDQVLPTDLTSATSPFKIVTNANDRRTRNFYDNEGHLIGTLDAGGFIVESVYDNAGHLKQRTGYANIVSSTLWASGTWSQLKTSAGTDTETATDPERDSSTYFLYDGQGRQVGQLDGEGYLTEMVYDVAGNVSQTIRYDKPLTYSTTSTLASLRTAATAAPAAPTHTTSYLYDGAGRVLQSLDFEGTQTNRVYDSVGNLTSTSAATGTSEARVAQARYDLLGRVIRELSGEGSQALATFMAANPTATQTQIDAVWDQYGVLYAYDLAGRKISATTRPNDSQTNTTRYYYDNDGLLRFEVNQSGERTEYRYNALEQVSDKIVYFNRISVASLTGGLLTSTLITTLTASADSTKDAKSSYTYTLTGALNTTTTVEGASTTYTYNAFGQNDVSIAQIDATRAVRHEYTYNTRGLLTNTKWDAAAGGLATTEVRAYDAFGRLTQVTDSRGNISKVEYDRLGRTTATVDELAGRRLITYDGFSRTLTTRDALTNTTIYSYNDSTRTMTVTTPEGIAVSTVHNRHGQTLSITAAGNTSSYVYNRDGSLTAASDTLGTLEGRTYDRGDRLLTQTDARGIVTSLSYDAANRVLTRTVDSASGGLALLTTYVYDGEGRLTDVTEPNGRLTRTTYDRDGRVTQVAVDPSGLNIRTSYTYDRQGHTLTVTEGFGGANPRTTQYTYDNLGRRTIEVVDPGTGKLNLTTQYKYDANDNLTRKIDARGYSTWYVYDAANRLTNTVDALGGVTLQSYDAENRVTATRRYATALSAATMTTLSTTDAPSAATVALSTNSLDRQSRSFYDRDGREQYTIDATGGVTERLFNAAGNVTRLRVLNSPKLTGTYANTAAVTTALGTAATTIGTSDRVTWMAYDLRDRAEFTVTGLGAVTRNTYDANGNVTKSTAFATLRLTTDPTDLASLQSWAGTNASATTDRTTLYWYDATDRARFTLNAEGYLAEARYNDAGRQESSIVYAAKPTGLSASSTFANLVSAATTIAVPANDQTTTSFYDTAGRVFKVTDALGKSEFYGYDEVGNKTSFTNKKATAAGEVAYTWNYEYDANGRLIYERTPAVDSTFVTESSPTAALSAPAATNARLVTKFEYDALGNLRFKREAYGTTLERSTEYLYDELGRQTRTNLPNVGVSVYNSTAGDVALGNNATVTRTEVSAPSLYTEVAYNTLGDAYRNRDVAGNYSFKVYDNLGRVTYEVDAENYVTKYGYDTFGNQTSLLRYANPLLTALPTTGTIAAADITTTRLVADATRDRTLAHSYDLLNRVTWTTGPTVSNFNPNSGSAGGTTFSSGATTLNAYNAFGDVVRSSEVVATSPTVYAHTYFYYDLLGQKIAQVDPASYLTIYEYDETGDLKRQVEYAKPRTGTLSNTTYGTIVKSTRALSPNDPAGYDRETTFAYDQLNRKITETKIGVEYFSVTGITVSSPTVGNVVTTFGYDALGNQTSVKDNNNATTYTYYDVLGRTIAIAEPARDGGDGTTLIPLTRLYVDVFGNIVQQVAYGGGAASIPASGLPTAATAPAATPNRTTTMLLDRAGHLIRSTDASGANVFTSYNARGDIAKQWQVVTNPGSAGVSETLVTIYQYDKLGRQTATISPQKHTSTTATVKITNVTEYNAFGEKTFQGVMDGSANQGRQEYFDYDLAGRVWRTNSGDGINKVYLFNLAGRATVELRSQTVDLKSTLYASADDVVNNVAAANLIRTETRYDTRGNVVEQRLPSWTTSNGLEQVTASPQIGLIGGSNYVYWTASANLQAGAQFAYRVAGSNTAFTTLGVSIPQAGVLGTNVNGLVNQTYEYRISYRYTGETAPYAESSGTFRMDTSTTTSVAITRNVPDTSNDVGTLSLVQSAAQGLTVNATGTQAWYQTGPNPTDGQWIYDNMVDVSWASIGAGTRFKLVITYVNMQPPGTAPNATKTHRSDPLTAGDLGYHYTWKAAAADFPAGGLWSVTTVQVVEVDANGNELQTLRQTGGVAGPPRLSWATPADSSVTAVFRYKPVSDSTFSSVSASRFGSKFEVDTQSLLTSASVYDYEVEHWKGGLLVAKKTGQINSTGVVTTRTVSGSIVQDPISTFNQNVATPYVNGLSMEWVPPSGATVTPIFEYRPQGGSYSTLSISQGARWSVDLGGLSQNQPYDYQITYVIANRVVSQQRGAFSIAFTPSSTTTTVSTSTDAAPANVGPISALSGMIGLSGVTTTIVRSEQFMSQGPDPDGGQWIYWNEVNLSWSPIGNIPATVTIQYYNASTTGAKGSQKTITIPLSSSISSGITGHQWNSLSSERPRGGIYLDAATVTVTVKAADGTILRQTGASGASAPPSVSWAAPAESGLTPRFWVNGSERTVTRNGSTLTADLAGVAPGDYSYEVGYYRAGESQSIVYTTGTVRTNGVSTTVLSQNNFSRNPAWLSVSASGNSASWQRSADQGGTVSFSYYNGSSWVPVTPATSDGTNYTASFQGLASGTYQYDLSYSSGSGNVPYVRSTGTVTVTSTTTTNSTVLNLGAPTFNQAYPAAAISPVSLSSDTVSWSYPKQYSASDSIVFRYTVNTTTYTPAVSGSGPGYSVVLSSLPFASNMAVTWTLEYTRSGEGIPYAMANGRATMTVSGTSTSPTVTIISQNAGYPSGVTEISAPTDTSNNSLRWTTPASGATVSFTANGAALPVSGNDSAGYTADLSSLGAGTYTYEILYRQGAQNPFARATGTFTITRAAGPVTSRNVTINAAPGASTDPDTRDAQVLNSNVFVGTASAANHPDNGYYRSETRGPMGELYITYDWMPERAVVSGSTISGGYDRMGNLDAAYVVTPGKYLYWSDPSDTMGESTPVVVWRTVGTTTWNTISTIEKVFNGARQRFLGVKVASMGSGNIEYQIRYLRAGDSTPFAVRTGTVNNPQSATGVTDTTAASITSTRTFAPSLTQTVDRWGNILTSTDAFGKATIYRYNQFSELVEKKLPSVQIVSVNALGAMTTTTGTPTSLQYYDAMGRLIATKDGDGNVNALTLNNAGQVTRDTHADSNFHKYTYDVFGNKIAETNERNFITQYTYNGRNLLTKSVQDAGATPTFAAADLITTQFVYDEAGRRVAVVDGNTFTSRTWYDLVGNVRQTATPLGYAKTYEYDLRGTKTKETDEIGGVLQWTYDYFGHAQTHNELGSAATPGTLHNYNYNKAGLAISVTSSLGQSVAYKYDEAGHLIQVTESGTAAAGSGLVAVPRVSRYRYDLMGRHSRETTIIFNRIEQDALITYDAAGRLAAMWDKNGGTKVSYDAASNRTRIQSSAAASQDDLTYTSSPLTFTWATFNLISSNWYTQTNAWNTADTDLWYAYDNMNRMAISRGTLAGSTVSGGVALTYDAMGNKKTRAEQGKVWSGGAGGKWTSTNGLSTDTYTYDGANRVTDVSKDGTVIEHYVYDKGSRQTTSVTATPEPGLNGTYLVTRTQTTNYNADSRLTSTSTTRKTSDTTNTGTKTESVVTYENVDAAGNVRTYKVDAYKADGTAIQYSLRYQQAYRLGDSYQGTTLGMTKVFGTGGPTDNTTTQNYDLDGNLASFQDLIAPTNNRTYAVNADGQILSNSKSRFFFANGQNVGSLLLTQRQYTPYAESLVSGFAFNVDDGVVSGADVQTPTTVTAQDKDTLRAIAQRLFGDGSLWYVLADANGMSDPDAQLVEGMIIRVPNEVVSVGNNASVYKPFDVAAAIGNTSPEQVFPYVPPPPPKNGCGILGAIIVIIVAVVVTYFTAGALSEVMVPWVAGALGAAAGSIASQVVGIGIGVQDKFSWSAVAKAAIGGAVSGALFGVDKLSGVHVGGKLAGNWMSTAAFGKTLTPYIQAGLNSAAANFLTQGISVAVGLQDKFSWRDVAASSAGGVAGFGAGKLIGNSLTNSGLGKVAGSIATDTATGFASGVAQAAVRGGKIDFVSIAVDAFGNAIGNSIAATAGAAVYRATHKETADGLEEVVVTAKRSEQVPLTSNPVDSIRAGAEASGDQLRQQMEKPKTSTESAREVDSNSHSGEEPAMEEIVVTAYSHRSDGPVKRQAAQMPSILNWKRSAIPLKEFWARNATEISVSAKVSSYLSARPGAPDGFISSYGGSLTLDGKADSASGTFYLQKDGKQMPLAGDIGANLFNQQSALIEQVGNAYDKIPVEARPGYVSPAKQLEVMSVLLGVGELALTVRGVHGLASILGAGSAFTSVASGAYEDGLNGATYNGGWKLGEWVTEYALKKFGAGGVIPAFKEGMSIQEIREVLVGPSTTRTIANAPQPNPLTQMSDEEYSTKYGVSLLMLQTERAVELQRLEGLRQEINRQLQAAPKPIVKKP